MVARYYRDADRGLYEPAKTNPSFFEGSSIGTALVENVNALNAAKAQKVRQTGETKLKSVTACEDRPRDGPQVHASRQSRSSRSWSATTSPASTSSTAKGKSIVPASRKPTGLRLVGVVNREYPSPDGWRVEYVQPKADKC